MTTPVPFGILTATPKPKSNRVGVAFRHDVLPGRPGWQLWIKTGGVWADHGLFHTAEEAFMAGDVYVKGYQ